MMRKQNNKLRGRRLAASSVVAEHAEEQTVETSWWKELNEAGRIVKEQREQRLREKRKVESERVKRSLLKTKRECFEAYGNRCACCGEKREAFLSLDHIGGNKKTPKLVMRSYGYSAHAEYRALRDQGYPKENHRLL